MSHDSKNIERASDRFPGCQSPQTRYTASYSYLLEAELDREWEKMVRNGHTLPAKRLEVFAQEEGRV